MRLRCTGKLSPAELCKILRKNSDPLRILVTSRRDCLIPHPARCGEQCVLNLPLATRRKKIPGM